MKKGGASLLAFLACAVAPAVARADVSSWFLVAGGVSRVGLDHRSPLRAAMMTDIGVGTPASHSIVVGGGARLIPYFGEGVELAAYLRGAMPSYAMGRFGLAVDAGAFTRPFAQGSPGFMGTLNLGAPWGITLSATYGETVHGQGTVTVLAGIDFLRLTVYRTAGETVWPNPYPAYRPPGEVAPTPALPEQQLPAPPPTHGTDVF